MSIFKFNFEHWAFKFFKNTQLSEDQKSLIVNNTDADETLKEFWQELKFALQDSPYSKIPSGAALIHRHYYNQAVFGNDINGSSKLYWLLKASQGSLDNAEVHVEFYLRFDGISYRIGYEAAPSEKASVEPDLKKQWNIEYSIFDTKFIHTEVLDLALRALNVDSIDDISAFRKAEEEHTRRQLELITGL